MVVIGSEEEEAMMVEDSGEAELGASKEGIVERRMEDLEGISSCEDFVKDASEPAIYHHFKSDLNESKRVICGRIFLNQSSSCA